MNAVTPIPILTSSTNSPLKLGNSAMRAGQPDQALQLYLAALAAMPGLAKTIEPNLAMARNKYRAQRSSAAKPRVAVCGWELSHNAAGRVHTLAMLYETFAEVEIIGSHLPGWGREMWEPIRDTPIAKHSFVVEDETNFIDKAIQLVAAHPYDIVHLSKPRAPNIFFGILYKLIWGAKVLMDIDDEELAFVGAETPISVDDYIQQHGKLPDMKDLAGKDWTRLAVGLAKEFDGVTVCNTPLQQRYGGEIIRHARDEKLFKPSPELKRQSRDKYGLPQDKKVVLFFGTPREHKGLTETAQAIAELNRPDILFCIVGDFADSAFKKRLQQITDCHFAFLPNQPFNTIPEVVSMADCCVLIQSSESLVTCFQTPAKLSDAIALNVPVLTTQTPALAEILAAGAVLQVSANTLAKHLTDVLNVAHASMIDAAKRYFEKYLSFATCSQNLRQVLDVASHCYPYISPTLGQIAVGCMGQTLHQIFSQVHASQSVHQSATFIDWAAQRNKPRQPDHVSIIIPIYNQQELTAACIASLYQHTAVEHFELILVDNGSDTQTQCLLKDLASKHPNLHLLRNAENLNFAFGCNLGFAASKGEFVIFLNNDTIVTAQWLTPLIDALRRPDIAAVQPKLLYPDGNIQCIGVVFSAKSPLGYPIYAGMQPDHPWAYRSRAFQAVTGACMGLRADDFAALQGFDPIYINGQEDIDLCLRLNKRYARTTGWVATESTVCHYESKTPNRFKHVERNRMTYVRRWANLVVSDDLDYYAEDGFRVTGYQSDSPKMLPKALQVYRPQLDLAASRLHLSTADSIIS